MSVPPIRMSPVIVTPSTRSFIRFRQRSSVDLPQPEGPMYAVIRCLATDIDTSLSASLAPYQRERCSISTIGISMIDAASARGFRLARSSTGPCHVRLLQTAAVAYFRRSRLRRPMAKRLSTTTMISSRSVVVNTMGRAASTFGDWKPTS